MAVLKVLSCICLLVPGWYSMYDNSGVSGRIPPVMVTGSCDGICQRDREGDTNVNVLVDLILQVKCDQCEDGFKDYFGGGNEKTGSCYKFLHPPSKFIVHRKICQQWHGDFVSIESQEEQDHLRLAASKSGSAKGIGFWTSALFNRRTEQWSWNATGQKIEFTQWAFGQPEPTNLFYRDWIMLDHHTLKWLRAWNNTPNTGICEKPATCK